MKKIKITLMILIMLISSILTAGCWNYREIDTLAIVAGVAVDKGINGQYKVTVEIAQISGGREAKITPKIISMEGRTIFDAVRNAISLSGKKLYFSHAKVIIISKEIASEGIIKVLDWYNRDSETRNDVNILISRENTAEEIFKGKAETEDIKSFMLDDMLKDQVNLSKAPIVNMFQFDNDMEAQGLSPIVPAVDLKQTNGEISPQIMGTAIFKKDKLAGFLDGDETKDLIFIKNEVKGGVLTEGSYENDVTKPVSLEVLGNKTKVTPVIDGENIKINVNIDTTASIDEIGNAANYIDEEGRKELEQNAGETLKGRIEALIRKIQSEYDADIFGFGAKIREDKSGVWNSVGDNWDEAFKNLKVNVSAKVHIKNSALFSRPLETGE